MQPQQSKRTKKVFSFPILSGNLFTGFQNPESPTQNLLSGLLIQLRFANLASRIQNIESRTQCQVYPINAHMGEGVSRKGVRVNIGPQAIV
jgi:hypothetical protein